MKRTDLKAGTVVSYRGELIDELVRYEAHDERSRRAVVRNAQGRAIFAAYASLHPARECAAMSDTDRNQAERLRRLTAFVDDDLDAGLDLDGEGGAR